MSAMMEQTPPFRTLLGHAFVRDEKGEEMSKSGPNSIVFDEGAEKAGVDAMRWLFCRQNPSNNLNFGYTLTEQVRRKVFNTWWNTLSFFISYARTDDFDPALPKVPVAERQDLDRWILSRLQELLATANERLAEYDAPSLVRAAEEFIDALSTWYVRRSRRRFWRPKDPNDRDKLAAYQTLHEALVALCKALAPVVPFLTERFYQRLVRDVDPAAPESVHHCDYPQPDPALHDEALSREMDAAMQIVSDTLALRESRQLRVRQPLSEMIRLPAPADETQANALRRFKAHILDELNIKKLTIAHDLTGIVSYEIKPNMKLLGPKYGNEAGRLRELLAVLVEKQGAAWVAEQVLKKNPIKLRSGEEFLPEEIIVDRKEAAGWAVSAQGQGWTGINYIITPELEREGFARDIVRHIQQIRKELDLDLMDHVTVAYETADEVLLKAIEENRPHIRGETLCDDLFPGHSESAKDITLSGRDIRLTVQKVG
jgi:isoleucyl-tRNA synthetase